MEVDHIQAACPLRETSSLFYAQNCFDFTMATPEQLVSFLGTIGRNSTNYTQLIYVGFPNFHYQEPASITLSNGSISIFASIQSSCVNLSTKSKFESQRIQSAFATVK
jgi:hypothetical protein